MVNFVWSAYVFGTISWIDNKDNVNDEHDYWDK